MDRESWGRAWHDWVGNAVPPLLTQPGLNVEARNEEGRCE